MFSKTWFLSTGERVGKSFVQGYVAMWVLSAGLTNTVATVPNADAFDTLFTMDNVKAGAVMAALSLVTSLGSTPFGPDSNAPSLTVTESPPTVDEVI